MAQTPTGGSPNCPVYAGPACWASKDFHPFSLPSDALRTQACKLSIWLLAAKPTASISREESLFLKKKNKSGHLSFSRNSREVPETVGNILRVQVAPVKQLGLEMVSEPRGGCEWRAAVWRRVTTCPAWERLSAEVSSQCLSVPRVTVKSLLW